VKVGRCYGLECGHHTEKQFKDIPLDEFGDITIDNKAEWGNLIDEYYDFTKTIVGLSIDHCSKCHELKRIIRIHIFVDNIFKSGSGIKT
jgi:hypothetical protein